MDRNNNKTKSSLKYLHRVERFISVIAQSSFQSSHPTTGIVLAYHNIVPDADESSMRTDSVKTTIFEAQMRFLVENDFKVIPLQELVRNLMNKQEVVTKTVVITFDDGYQSTLTRALPILQKYHLPATVFLAVDYIGEKQSFLWLRSYLDADDREDLAPLNWDEVKQLYHAGMEIGSHTCSHSFLPIMDKKAIEKELLESGRIIQRKLGELTRSLALPFSFPIDHSAWPHFKDDLVEGLEIGGYNSCCTLCRGTIDTHSDPCRLARMCINKYDDLLSFSLKINGAYIWTRYPQSIYQKYFKNYHHLHSILHHDETDAAA